jgi:hypothetical protein
MTALVLLLPSSRCSMNLWTPISNFGFMLTYNIGDVNVWLFHQTSWLSCQHCYWWSLLLPPVVSNLRICDEKGRFDCEGRYHEAQCSYSGDQVIIRFGELLMIIQMYSMCYGTGYLENWGENFHCCVLLLFYWTCGRNQFSIFWHIVVTLV